MLSSRLSRAFVLGFVIVLLAGCTVFATKQLDDLYGEAEVRDRTLAPGADSPEYFQHIKPVIDQRCVVCHGCYDAPCQLKLSSYEGIERGISQEQVYDGSRLIPASLSRLFVDADSTAEWRDKGFHPVLNERDQTPEANLAASTFYRTLALKEQNPLPPGTLLPETFDLSLNRDQQCATIEAYDQFEKDYPLWGMPYGLPAIEPEKMELLTKWVEAGAPAKPYPPLSGTLSRQVAKWESFFNGNSLKQKLVSRYIYEHLYVAHIYFPEADSTQFFQLVRSTTPSGKPVDVIGSRRPFDDPGVTDFYYRLQPVRETITVKNHMPYRLDSARRKRWNELFFEADYRVDKLPGYDSEVASNPFASFQQLPVKSRYQFMLDDAEYIISAFIKGPVCRGQVALNVINDRFWVVFVDPDDRSLAGASDFLGSSIDLLQMPAEGESVGIPLSRWVQYSSKHRKFVEAKQQKFNEVYSSDRRPTLDLIWDGDGNNKNAALTVFRHFDSATVKQGLIGDLPKTAWLIDYTLLERIYYLLVAGFDVYGNVGHQLLTRLYMDFLRMEGESDFLALLPADVAEQELSFWYRGEEGSVTQYLEFLRSRSEATGIEYKTDNPKQELFELLQAKLGRRVIAPDPINRPGLPARDPVTAEVQRLAKLQGATLTLLPEQMTLQVLQKEGQHRVFSLIRDVSHSNLSHPFGEERRLVDDEYNLTVVEGILGSYPNAFVSVTAADLGKLVDRFYALRTEADYRELMDRYGIRRTSDQFWTFSDWLHDYYQQTEPVYSGLLDYNRLENR